MTGEEIIALVAASLALVYVGARWELSRARRHARAHGRFQVDIDDAGGFPVRLVHVVGENPDASDRQAAIRSCVAGEPLSIVTNPTDPTEPAPTAVIARSGQLVGYLPREIARRLHSVADPRVSITTFVMELTGGGDEHRTVGLTAWISIVRTAPGVELRRRLRYLGRRFSRWASPR
jgi:hypothetical protein